MEMSFDMGVQERKNREKEERRKQILASARGLLFEKGFSSVSVQMIATEAEISVGTIYLYFNSKEEIFAALQEEGLKLLFTQIKNEYHKGKNPEEQIKKMAAKYFQFSQKYKEYFKIINFFLSSPDVIFPENLKNQIDTWGNDILYFIYRAIEDGIEKGIFTSVDPQKYAILIWGTLHGLLQFRKLRDTIIQKDTFENFYQYGVDHLLEGLKSPKEDNNK